MSPLLPIAVWFVTLSFYCSATFAQGFVFVNQHKGESSYIVESGNLESKLDFPFKFQAVGAGFNKTHQDIHYTFKLSKLANSLVTTGEDYDWENNRLNLFSNSNSKVEDFFHVGLEASKNITERSAIFVNAQYSSLDLLWSDTKQQNYVTNQLTTFTGDTLSYEQEFYQLNLGVSYQYPLSNDISLNLKPSIIFAYVESTDKHLLRNFYTVQDNLARGYGIGATLVKSMDKDSTLSLSVNKESYKDRHNKMHYYQPFIPSYSLPASYKHNTQKIEIFYQQQF